MTTKLQSAMILKIAHSEFTPLNGAPPESPDDTETWQEMIVEDAEDKGVFTSLLNAGLVASNGRGKDAGCSLTQAGLEEYKKITTQQQENTMKTKSATYNLESLSKSQLADHYNSYASQLKDCPPVKSFRDVATGLRRVREIQSKVMEQQQMNKEAFQKTTKNTPKGNKPKYTRADALSDTLKEMKNGTDQEIIAASNERYVQKGGKNNLKEASWSFRIAVPVLMNLGVVSKDSQTGFYSINLK